MRQPIQNVAIVTGVAFVGVAVLGFLAGSSSMMSMSNVMLFGRFPVNVLHNAAHGLFGVWGLWAGTSRRRATTYALGSGAAYMVLAIAGLVSPMLLGFIPIGGYDIPLHVVLAVALAGAGVWTAWVSPSASETTKPASKRAA
jgi:hypothetical protein